MDEDDDDMVGWEGKRNTQSSWAPAGFRSKTIVLGKFSVMPVVADE